MERSVNEPEGGGWSVRRRERATEGNRGTDVLMLKEQGGIAHATHSDTQTRSH